MNVTFVQHRAGSRIPRLARALTARGHVCRTLTREPLWEDDPAWDRVSRWGYPTDVVHRVLEDDWTEVFHVSQDFDCEWVAAQVLAARNHAGRWWQRVVWDLRDIGSMHHRQLWRAGRMSPPLNVATMWENWGANRVDGLVHVSPACERWFRDTHPLVEIGRTPTAIVRSMVGRDQLAPWPDSDTRAGLVYSGGINGAEVLENGAKGATRCYGEHMRAFLASEAWGAHPVSIQTASNEQGAEEESYRALGVEVHPRVSQAELVSSLTRFRWGLVSFGLSYALGEAAFPNKLWEYLAAGVVPVCVWAHQAQTFCEEQGVGIGGRSLEEAIGKMTRETWEGCHANIRRQSKRWVMEEEAGTWERLARNVLAAPPRFVDPRLPAAEVWDPLLDLAREMGHVVEVEVPA